MPTHDYYAANGDKLPSVTTVLGQLGWKSNGLMYWAYGLGKLGKDLKETRNALAEAGTLAHLMASCDIKGQPQPDVSSVAEEIRTKAQASFEAYLTWKRSTLVELAASEVSLVSEEHRFAGCLDAVAVKDGVAGILDFKSSKALYPDTVVQVAAYWKLWEENNPDLPVHHWHVLRWSPDGSFHHDSLSRERVEAGWRVFQHCLGIYNLRKAVAA